MMKIDFSRPATYLTVFALATLAVSDCKLGQAAQPADAIQVDAYFVPSLLTPMSPLVPSPYAELASLNNPLGIEQSSTSPRSEAIRSVVSLSPSHAATATLDASAKEPAPKIALPHAGDFTLTAQMTISIEPSIKQIAPVKNSLAMTER